MHRNSANRVTTHRWKFAKRLDTCTRERTRDSRHFSASSMTDDKCHSAITLEESLMEKSGLIMKATRFSLFPQGWTADHQYGGFVTSTPSPTFHRARLIPTSYHILRSSLCLAFFPCDPSGPGKDIPRYLKKKKKNPDQCTDILVPLRKL